MTHQIEIRPTDTPRIIETRRLWVDVEANLVIPVRDTKLPADQTVETLIVHWTRPDDGPWKLGSVQVRGHQIRKDGSVGKAPRETHYPAGSGAGQPLLDFIEQYRPADTSQ